MTTKVSLPFTPKVFWGGVAGFGLTLATAVASVVNPHLFSALGPVWEVPAAAAASNVLQTAIAWFKKESADETPAAKVVSDEAAKTVEDAASKLVPITVEAAPVETAPAAADPTTAPVAGAEAAVAPQAS